MENGDFKQCLTDLQGEYLEFLDDEKDQGIYMEKVKQMIADKSQRLVVSVNDLRCKNPERARMLLDNAFEEQIVFQKALKEYVSSIDPTYAKVQEEFFVAFNGNFGNNRVTPRSLTSRYLGKLICLEGIVTRVSLVRPKIVRSVHYCPATKKVIEKMYTDLTSFEAFPTSADYPTKDDEGNPLETEYGLSRYKDHQTITVQEMPERAPAGQLPRSVDIICDDDLVDKCKPGDRVQIVGNYRCLPSEHGSFTAGTFRTILIANNVTQINKDMNLTISLEDVKLCKRLVKSGTTDMFDLLSKSLAPSIHGHDYIKKAILCLLLGGMEKVLPNGTRLRGDINILLIGDPSVAKSQLLRYVSQTAPRAITTTGRGSLFIYLFTTDPETGDRRLEAGAMVLADRGVVCIDEFDKMSDIDRTAIHEVMEQGRVTIAKAGVHATLNARCSVLAAAIPVYGRYDQYKTPMENIGLQDSLLSRFDLLFVMLDIADADHDNMISEHVLRMHRYRSPKEQDGEVLPMDSTVEMLSTENPDNDEAEETNTSIYEKYDPLLHGNTRSKKEQYLNTKFMRKFIHIARLMKPKLTQEASDSIADEYARLRNQDMMDSDVARTQPVTARTLETLIRLSTAHAKCRLSFKITQDDALAAIELVQFAYFKKVLTKEQPCKRRASSDEEPAADEGEQAAPTRAMKSRKTASREQLRRRCLWQSHKARQRRQRRMAKGGAPCPDAEIDANIAEISRDFVTLIKADPELIREGETIMPPHNPDHTPTVIDANQHTSSDAVEHTATIEIEAVSQHPSSTQHNNTTPDSFDLSSNEKKLREQILKNEYLNREKRANELHIIDVQYRKQKYQLKIEILKKRLLEAHNKGKENKGRK